METLFERRLELLRNSFEKTGIDTFLVLVQENRRYLSGFTGEDTQYDESAGALFVAHTQCILATDARYELQARGEAPFWDIVCYRDSLAKALPDILNQLKTKRLGFETNRLSYRQFKKINEQLRARNSSVELVETEDLVETLRVIKTDAEIRQIQNALALAESTFKNIAPTIRPGLMETEVAWAVEKGMRESGADSVSFPIIVASGPNSALPHAIPGKRRLREGEPILLDWGAKLNGYCSDISRTLLIGTPDETFQKVFKTVHEAQQKAIAAIRPGTTTKAVDEIARIHIESMGFKGKFGHGLGHGTGLAIHEYPRLSPFNDKPLEIGMVFTVEPGIYLPEWGGIRLENMVVVREDGAEVLNRLDGMDFQLGGKR